MSSVIDRSEPATDPARPDWYAERIVREQAGDELPA